MDWAEAQMRIGKMDKLNSRQLVKTDPDDDDDNDDDDDDEKTWTTTTMTVLLTLTRLAEVIKR